MACHAASRRLKTRGECWVRKSLHAGFTSALFQDLRASRKEERWILAPRAPKYVDNTHVWLGSKVYTDVYVYIYIYACMHACMYACMYVCVYVYIYIYVYINVYLYV